MYINKIKLVMYHLYKLVVPLIKTVNAIHVVRMYVGGEWRIL